MKSLSGLRSRRDEVRNVLRRSRAKTDAFRCEPLELRWLLSAAAVDAAVVDRTPAIQHGALKSIPAKGVIANPGNPAVTDPSFTPIPASTQQQSVLRGNAAPAASPAAQSSLTIVPNLTNPHGLVVDESGNVWVSAQGPSAPSNVLYEYSPAGTLLGSYVVDTSSTAQPGALSVVSTTNSGSGLAENTILWEKEGGQVWAFNPATQTQSLLFTADSLAVDLSSVYEPNLGGSYNFSSSITSSTAVYQNGLAFDDLSTYDAFFLTGVSNNVPFILRVEEQNGSIIGAKVIAASLDAPSGGAYNAGVAVTDGVVMTLLPYSSSGTSVPFLFTDNYPETSGSQEATFSFTSMTGYAISADYEANFIVAAANPAPGAGQTAYYEVNFSTGNVQDFNTTIPSVATSYGISFSPATNTVLQDYTFNSVSSGYGEIWNEPLSTVFSGYSPAQIRQYYGLNQVSYPNGTPADGTGQTIAIIDFGGDPNLSAELTTFDSAMGIAAPPSLQLLSETGTTTLPAESTETAEESLDVEWSHAIAPGAKIIVFETSTASNGDVTTAINTAKAYAGVSVVSMSFGEEESSGRFTDATFVTPAGHTGVTFVASSGDGGAYPGNPGQISAGAHVNSPASSPNVLSVGGTTLNYNASTGTPASETAWGYVYPGNSGYYEGSGGGVSTFESEPSYQTAVAGTLSGRGVPDVSFLADPDTGVKQYDMQQGGWFVDGGTSLSAPCWAGIIAVINQGRTLHGQPVLNASTDLTNPALYSLNASNFSDITSGNNGVYSTKVGYDEVTGRGTPLAARLIPDMEAAFVTVSTVTLPAATHYIRLDPDGVDVDIYNNTTGTGTPAEFFLLQTVSSLSVTGPNGTDSLTVDWSKGTPLPAAGLTFTALGSSSGNVLNIIGTASGNDTVASSTSQISVNSVPVNFSDVGSVTFTDGTGTDALTVNSGTLLLLQRAGSGIITDLFSGVTLNGAATLAVAPPATHGNLTLLNTQSLTLAGATNAWTATLDLNANDLAVLTGNLSVITNQLAAGFANGAWNGTGIDSSAAAANTSHLTALGSILNTTNGTTVIYGSGTTLGTFDGASPGAAAVLVKYTYYGDANLDGRVDGSDYTLIDNGFNNHLTGWYNGDFNYDTGINGSDYTLVDNAFNTQGASLAAQVAPSSAPAIPTPAKIAPVYSNQPITTANLFTDASDKRRHTIADVGLE
jgi:hypothetical protein